MREETGSQDRWRVTVELELSTDIISSPSKYYTCLTSNVMLIEKVVAL